MAIQSNLAGVARVAIIAETGEANAEIQHTGRVFQQTSESMSASSIRIELAQRRLNRELAASKPNYDRVLRATLSLKSAQRQAADEVGRTAAVTGRAGASLLRFGHDAERAGLGALAGSKAVHGLRQALIFGGAGFLSGFGVGAALRAVRDAAIEQQASLGQLQTALKAAGSSQSAYSGQVKEAIEANQRLGFSQGETVKSFTLALRATKDVAGAIQILSTASNISRGSGRALLQSTLLTTRAFQGQSGSLRRVGIDIGTNVKGYEAVARAQAKFAGSARTYADSAAGAQARLNVAVHTTEETIGTALLPTITGLNTHLAAWLDNSNNQARIQRAVNRVAKDGAVAVHDFGKAVHDARVVLSPLNRLLGGTEHTVRLLAGAFVAMKLGVLPGLFRAVSGSVRVAGSSAAVAAGEFNTLAGAEERAAAARFTGGVPGGPGGGVVPFFPPGGGGPASKIPLTDFRTVAQGGLGARLLARFGAGAADLTLGGGGFILPGISSDSRPGATVHTGQTIIGKGGKKFVIIATPSGQILTIVPESEYRRALLQQGNKDITGDSSVTGGAGQHGALQTNATRRAGGAGGRRGRRPPSLTAQFNLAANRLAQAGLTADTGDDLKELDAEAAILRKQIAAEKTLAGKTALISQLGGVLDQAQAIRDANAQKVVDRRHAAAEARTRKREAAQKRAKKRQAAIDAKIKRLYAEDVADRQSSAESGLKARSDYLNKLYHLAGAASKTTPAPVTAADIAASGREALATLQEVIRNQSNFKLPDTTPGGHTIIVNQHFPHPPTNDGRREAILAHFAMQSHFA